MGPTAAELLWSGAELRRRPAGILARLRIAGLDLQGPYEGIERLLHRATERVRDAAKKAMRVHVEAMLAFEHMGIPTFDYGNNIRQMAFDEGCKNAFDFPGFVPAYVRPLFCRGIGPFRWVALSGDPEDIYRTDQRVKEMMALVGLDDVVTGTPDLTQARIGVAPGCTEIALRWQYSVSSPPPWSNHTVPPLKK